MPPTLPVSLTPGATGHILHHDLVHGQINRALDATPDGAVAVDFEVEDLTELGTITGMVQGSYAWLNGTDEFYRFNGADWKPIGSTSSSGLFADRPAAGNEGRFYIATWDGTTIIRLYYDDGTDWTVPSDAPGKFNPLDYGADPTGATSSRDAVLACFAAVVEMWSGEPYADGVVAGEVEWTAGQYTIDGGDIEVPIQIKQSGVGGSQGQFADQRQVIVNFTTGGFVLGTSQSSFSTFEGMYVASSDGNALRCNQGAGPGMLRDSTFRGGNGHAGALLDNVFLSGCDNVTFQAPDTSTPGLHIKTSAAGGYEGWDFDFGNIRLNVGAIKWEIANGHPGGRVYGDMTASRVLAENLGANVPIFAIHNTGTSVVRIGNLDLGGLVVDDSGGNNDVIKLVAESSGDLYLQTSTVRTSSPSVGGYHLNISELSTGICYPDALQFVGIQAPLINWGAASSGFFVIGALNVEADRPLTIYRQAKVKGEAAARMVELADGSRYIYDGSSGPYQKIFEGMYHGDPNGHVVSLPSGTCHDPDTPALWFKATGTGNTGWVQVTHA